MYPWTHTPTAQLVALPGAPITCRWCGRPVRVAVQTPIALYCACGGHLAERKVA